MAMATAALGMEAAAMEGAVAMEAAAMTAGLGVEPMVLAVVQAVWTAQVEASKGVGMAGKAVGVWAAVTMAVELQEMGMEAAASEVAMGKVALKMEVATVPEVAGMGSAKVKGLKATVAVAMAAVEEGKAVAAAERASEAAAMEAAG